MEPDGEKRGPEPFPESMARVLDNPLAKAHARRVLGLLELREGMRILDVGAGTGRLAIPLAARVGPDGEVVATDIQPGMLARLEGRARAQGLTNIRTVGGAAGKTVLPRDHFDLAVIASVLGEIPEPERERAVREVHAALKTGGVLAVIESHPDPHFQPREDVRRLGERAGFELRGQRRLWLGFMMELVKQEPGSQT